MDKSLVYKFCAVVSLLLIGAGTPACTEKDTSVGAGINAMDTGAFIPDMGGDTETVSLGTSGAMQMIPQFDPLDDQACCENPGHANDCWEEDALDDNEEGFIFCNSDSDCGGRPCNTAAVDMEKFVRAKEMYKGMCECANHGDCRDSEGKGGSCFLASAPDASEELKLCGPSICNGYYVCSCWGGCVWWDGNDPSQTNTPMNDAQTLGMYCCESEHYSNPDENPGIVTFGNSSCAGDILTVSTCESDTDCASPSENNPDWSDGCISVSCDSETNRCMYTALATGTECTADADDTDASACDIYRCSATQQCQKSGPRCPTPTYMDETNSLQVNTCVNQCVLDTDSANTDGYLCNENREVPWDTDVKNPNGICAWWTCVDNGSGIHIPIKLTPDTDCALKSALDACLDYECNPADTDQGNCSAPMSDPDIPTNTQCNSARNIGGFTNAHPAGTRLAVYGDNRCVTNNHYASNRWSLDRGHCDDAIDPYTPLGSGGMRLDGSRGGRDLVYSFTYTGSGEYYPAYQYRIVLEIIEDNNGLMYDGAVYASENACGAASSDTDTIPSQVITHDNCHRIYPDGETTCQENDCYNDDLTPCTSTEGSAKYANAKIAQTVLKERTNTTEAITVYVYVDGDGTTHKDGGEFYLSVTKEALTDCPLPGTADFFYPGRVHRTMETYPISIPIDGVNFDPVPAADQVQEGTLGTVTGVVVSGNTSTSNNSYYPQSGEAGYDTNNPYAWGGYDEMWELSIEADGAQFSASLGDYGGGFDTDNSSTPFNKSFDPMLAVFNCHGERIDFNDNNSTCPNKTAPQIRPTTPVVESNGPYYVLVDGHYEFGTRGTQIGSTYDLSIFYDPAETHVNCDPGSAEAFVLRFPIDGAEPNTNPENIWPPPRMVDFTENCMFIEADTDKPYECDGISFYSNNTVPGPSQDCRFEGKYGFCMHPMVIKVSLVFEDASGNRCYLTDWLLTYDDHFNDIGANGYIELYDAHPDNPDCNRFIGAAIGFEYAPKVYTDTDSSPTKLELCEQYCAKAEWIKVVDSTPCNFK
ncbi:MAG: hypothetical protein JXR76_22695 [Deltaproteobacteria bacterium]|nr:hypothetical protein [Deltaproteobacteria bacterium]